MKPLFQSIPDHWYFSFFAITLMACSFNYPLLGQTEEVAFNKKYAVGLSTGLKSIAGIDGGLTLSPRFNIRVGYQYADLRFFDPDFSIEASSRSYEVDTKYYFSHIELLGEYVPLKFLRVVFGAGLFYKNTASIFVAPGEDSDFNDIILTPEEIGYLKGTSHYKSPIAPYAGIALGKLVPKKRIGLSCDIGAFYKGSPTVDIEATELLSENTRNEPILDRNLKPYRFFPNLSLRLAVRLN